ncbi:hypothetical protein BKP45_01715 [Anaerobacillus alkalidiazotrophicus]|uniref:Uncharacterized protein n=1 Tax=Anaerobacillus alkalidiazotrophicus TaxID=472963 RepID=A0A1S2M9Y1_9BACI|nr:hypothetical protein BKP45_01715 [Anaerobacillus alkalidiazotrophicus]
MSDSFYEKLPNDLLIRFYVEIKKNIETGSLTNELDTELKLIKAVSQKRNINLFDLNCNV